MYDLTIWQDHVVDQSGTVIQQGTMMDEDHFNRLENGVMDAHIAVDMTLMRILQLERSLVEAEVGTVTLTNSGEFVFNNSAKSVALATPRPSTNYRVDTEVTAKNGNVGEVEITGKTMNGFTIAFTGSATSVTVKYTVIGG